jgi:hypothetical protein
MDNTPWQQYIDINDRAYKILNGTSLPFQVVLDKNNRPFKILSYDFERDLTELLK